MVGLKILTRVFHEHYKIALRHHSHTVHDRCSKPHATPTGDTSLRHNKVWIFDVKPVCTGSFNWTNAAEKQNDENLVRIDGAQVAADYERLVFQRILSKETLVRPDK
ncbi:MAG TPA: phospholipase D-like domain-containing protein [Candidatus Kryptonia bacterium]|nr:phospholipase D-like domain-containing protein [Candidatus Kryptonia bacterium]